MFPSRMSSAALEGPLLTPTKPADAHAREGVVTDTTLFVKDTTSMTMDTTLNVTVRTGRGTSVPNLLMKNLYLTIRFYMSLLPLLFWVMTIFPIVIYSWLTMKNNISLSS